MVHLELPFRILESMDVLWTFMLLTGRYAGMFSFIPGLGQGVQGLRIRAPAVVILAYTTTISGQIAGLPADWFMFIAGILSEVMLGGLLGLVPTLVIAGLLTAGQLAATTMGLGASQLIDPSSGMQVPSLGRIMGDTMVCLFLLIGGHHAVLYAVAGLGGTIIPGTFLITESSIGMLVSRSGQIFTIGVMVSAPVIVALLLTQFVMGLVSKAVPQVNIFIVSFPLTIGIGLVLSALALPEVRHFTERELRVAEQALVSAVADTRQVSTD